MLSMHLQSIALTLFIWLISLSCDAIERSSSFKGELCHRPANVPSLIVNAALGSSPDCLMYKSGQFITPSSLPRAPRLPPCKSYKGGRFINGRWSDLPDGCSIHWHTPEEMRGALIGRHVLIQGDSMLRNVFHALIFHMRGIESIIETTYHDDAAYIFNETNDVFYLRSLTSEDLDEWKSALNQNQRRGGDSPSVFPFGLITFHWDISLSRGRIYDDSGFAPRPDLRLAGPGYWASTDGVPDPKQLAMLSEIEAYHRTKDVLLYSYPWLPRVKGNERYPEVHALRQAVIEKLGLYLPGEELANTSIFGKLEDEMHYSCRFRKGRFLTPKDGDCRDMFNRNMAMITLDRLSAFER